VKCQKLLVISPTFLASGDLEIYKMDFIFDCGRLVKIGSSLITVRFCPDIKKALFFFKKICKLKKENI
jgi:hypothetical protein